MAVVLVGNQRVMAARRGRWAVAPPDPPPPEGQGADHSGDATWKPVGGTVHRTIAEAAALGCVVPGFSEVCWAALRWGATGLLLWQVGLLVLGAGVGLTDVYVPFGVTDSFLIGSYAVWVAVVVLVALPGAVCWLVSDVALVHNLAG